MADDKDKHNADGGGQDKPAGGDADKKSAPITLTNEHLTAISESVAELLGIGDMKELLQGISAKLQDTSDFRQAITSEINGAVSRRFDKSKKKSDDDKGDDDTPELLNKTVKIGDDVYKVSDLVSAMQTGQQREQEIADQNATRAQEDKIRTVQTGLTERKFIGPDVIAPSLAAQVVREDSGDYTAKGITIKNSVGTEVKRDMPLTEYLDHVAATRPELVQDSTKPGAGSGGAPPGSGSKEPNRTAGQLEYASMTHTK